MSAPATRTRPAVVGVLAFLLVLVGLAPTAAGAADDPPADAAPPAAPSWCTASTLTGTAAQPDPSVSLVGLPPSTQLLVALAAGIIRESADQLTGWTLSTIFSGETETGKIRAQLDEVNAKIDGLHDQIARLDAEVKQNYEHQFTQDERREYDVQTAFLAADTGDYRNYVTMFDAWSKHPVGSAVDGTQSAALVQMRLRLGSILQHLNLAMVGQGSGRGMIEVYSSFLWRTQPGFAGGRLTPGQLYASDYTTPMNDMLDHWKGLAVDVFNLLAEVYHMTWTSGGVSYLPDTDMIQSYYNCLVAWFDTWDDLAGHRLGRLGDDVVVDHRHGLMWSRSAVADAPRPPSASWLSTLTIGGQTGWRLPSSNEVRTLLADPATPYPVIRPVEWMDAQGFTWPQYSVCCGPSPERVHYLVGPSVVLSDTDPATGRNKGLVITDDPSNPPDFRVFSYDSPVNVVVVRPLSAGLGSGPPPGSEPPAEGEVPPETETTTTTVTTTTKAPGAVVATPTFTG